MFYFIQKSPIYLINLSPVYDVVNTTFYIKNDISALTLMGSKKWWKRHHLVQFGCQVCDLTQKQANNLFDECLNALQKVLTIIEEKRAQPSNADRLHLLEHLKELILNELKEYGVLIC